MSHAETALPPISEQNRYIGKSVSRPNAVRLVEGRGTYVDDIDMPRLVHVVYWRSPAAHARITRIDASFARLMPGVVASKAVICACMSVG